MNVIRSEKTDAPEDDANLAAVTEVEAGIRDFVRNDVAYLRRPERKRPRLNASHGCCGFGGLGL